MRLDFFQPMVSMKLAHLCSRVQFTPFNVFLQQQRILILKLVILGYFQVGIWQKIAFRYQAPLQYFHSSSRVYMALVLWHLPQDLVKKRVHGMNLAMTLDLWLRVA